MNERLSVKNDSNGFQFKFNFKLSLTEDVGKVSGLNSDLNEENKTKNSSYTKVSSKFAEKPYLLNIQLQNIPKLSAS
jgi:hypothetical protein